MMNLNRTMAAAALSLFWATSASGQIVGGVMTVTGAEMH
jgi:hypothetical protein